MIDPLLSLAFSIHSNKGVYALLLGSGLSRYAGVLTGWEIVLDLTRKIAHLKGVDCELDPAAWYFRAFGKAPDYSELLEKLAGSATERRGLLRSYFEPTDGERERGTKAPSEAHKAIAELVAKGYVRVILTTNFDRLLEEALAAAGVAPTVISIPDAAVGAIPLVHSSCTVVKLHGDYLDIRIKNTPAELAAYDPRIDALLDRVFDEFGLLVCGWSAEWDPALRAALERCRSRRFCTHWTARSEPEGLSKRLIEFRGAQVIRIKDADTFFRQVKENVLALESFDRPHPLSAKVAVANLKRYIVEDRHKVLLHDLVTEETERVHEQISGAGVPARGAVPDAETIPLRASYFETAVDTLLQLVVHGCYWGEKQHEDLWTKSIERLANVEPGGEAYDAWTVMCRYPAMLLMYGGGIAAISASRYETVMGLLTRTRMHKEGKDRPAALRLNPHYVIQKQTGWLLPGLDKHHTPLSDRVRDLLLPKLKEFIPRKDEYDRLFDRFEYILALVISDHLEREQSLFRPYIGRFGWKGHGSWKGIREEIGAEIDQQGAKWPLLAAGLCGGSLERLRSIKAELDKHASQMYLY
jgi:hypothetical protein